MRTILFGLKKLQALEYFRICLPVETSCSKSYEKGKCKREAHRFKEEFDFGQNVASTVVENLLLNYLCWFHKIHCMYYFTFESAFTKCSVLFNFTLCY
jgi:hypothetical protein